MATNKSKTKTKVVDSDWDGIPDSSDPDPFKFQPTVDNRGLIQGGPNKGKQGFISDVQNIQIPGIDRGVTATEAKDWFKYLKANNPKLYTEITNNLKRVGIAPKDYNKAWADAVDWTQSLGANSSDPRQYFGSLAASDYATGSTKQYGTTTFKNTNVTEYSPSSAATDAQKMFRSEMGQEATQSQVDAYTKAVNAQAKKSPSVQSGSTTTTPKGSTTNSTSTTGFDPTEFARNFVKSQPNYAENFVASNAMDLIGKLLKDPNAVGNVVGNG